MKYNLRVLVFTIVFFANVLLACAQVDGRHGLSHFSIGEGLTNNSVTVIFQDSFGFLWIGTQDGLNRYDGYEFKTYRHNPSDESSICGNYIQTIVQDQNNNLWIGTRDSGLSKLDYSTGRFTSYTADSESDKSLPENSIYELLVDENNRLWVNTMTHLSLFRGDSLGFENYGHFHNVFNVRDALRYPLHIESDTSILVGTKDGINRFNTITKHFSRFDCISKDVFSCRGTVYDIAPFQDKYLVASLSGIQLLDIGVDLSVEAFPTGDENNIRGPVNDILELESGDFIAGTHDGIRVIANPSGEHHNLQQDGASILPYHVTSLFEDKSGIIWIGTRFKGLFKYDPKPPKFRSLFKESSENQDIKSLNYQAISQDSDGNIWLGTLERGIFKYNLKTEEVDHYFLNQEKQNSGADAVYVLYNDKSGRLWAGTNSGLYYYLPATDHFVEFDNGFNYGVDYLVKTNQIYDLSNDYHDNLWIGTRFGLYRYDGENVFSFFYDKTDSSGLYSDHINVLQLDDEGNLWIGTSKGLNFWDRDLKEIRRVSLSQQFSNYNRGAILSLNIDPRGRILVGTRSGLWVIPSKDETPYLMPGNSALDNDMIKSVISDNENRVWVATNKGIACLNPDGTTYNFDVNDGLPGYVFNNNSVYKNVNGNLLFGSTEGLCWFHPDSINYNFSKPPLSITKIQVFRRGENAENYWPVRKSMETKYRPFTSINVEFSALEFTQPEKNRYKVFLQGYDSNWRPVTYQNSVSFSNLLPGEYTLKILASNNDFIWNTEPLELDITVKPPLWMSNYAFAFYLLAFIFIIHLLINYRVRHYRKANKELQEKSVNKKQIEAQREVLTRINRSLTDSINYARRIQRAMIPSYGSFEQIFPDSFVYLRARDIVSGDFYWFHEKGDKVFVTAVDCTGHGVPGAFMSIIGIDLLKNIVEVQGLESPSEILETMNGELLRTLHKEQSPVTSDDNVNDGMDMSLVVFDRKEKKIEFAGAYNGFYLIRNNELHAYKGDRFPVGYLKDGELPVFTRKEVTLQKGDVVYLFSDGLADQFGGPDHKKFKYRRFRVLLLNIHKQAFPDQKAILHQKIEEWMDGDNEQVDDMLVIGFKPIG